MVPILQEMLGQSCTVGHNARGQSSILCSLEQFAKVRAKGWFATNKGNLSGTGISQHLWNQKRLFLRQLVALIQVVKVRKAECTGVVAPWPKVPINA